MAVDIYLALLANQQAGGVLTAEVAVRAATERTGRSEKDVRRVMEAVSWLLEDRGAKACKAIRPLCNVDAETLSMLEDALSRDWRLDRTLHRKPWSRSELRSAVVAYRQICQDEATGAPVDMAGRITELATRLGRKYSAVRLRMQNIFWIMSQSRLPVVACIPLLSGVGRKVALVVFDVHAELEAEERSDATGPAPWTEPQLRAALEAYREAVVIDPARAPVDLPDLVCELAQTAGRRFADAHRHIGFVAWLVRERGDRHPACIEPCGDMPAETRTVLERLLDAGCGA